MHARISGLADYLAVVTQDDRHPARHLVGIALVELLSLPHPHALEQVLHIRIRNALGRELLRPHLPVDQRDRT